MQALAGPTGFSGGLMRLCKAVDALSPLIRLAPTRITSWAPRYTSRAESWRQ